MRVIVGKWCKDERLPGSRAQARYRLSVENETERAVCLEMWRMNGRSPEPAWVGSLWVPRPAFRVSGSIAWVGDWKWFYWRDPREVGALESGKKAVLAGKKKGGKGDG
jgi:hypothetical protein